MTLIDNKNKPKQHKGAGHRKRLRDRFLQSGLSGFLDYEIVELLLTLGTPRKDCKQMAKKAIKQFKGLRGALDAPIEELQQIKGIGPYNAFGLKLFPAVSEQYAKAKLPKRISLHSPQAVAQYLREKIGKENKEILLVLSLDTHNNLIGITNISIGTLNANLVHPRETFSAAIKHHAASLIIAHNHPSGHLDPSPEDLNITKRLTQAGKILGIEIVDHIIVTKDGYFSFSEKKLL